jgi:hypothetical protein
MKALKRIALSFIGMLILQHTLGQKKDLPGYIIRLSGDTVKGFVQDINPDKKLTKVYFSESLTTAKRSYTPAEIREFSIADAIYVSAIVQVEVSPGGLSELQDHLKLDLDTDTTFLLSMINGIKYLYAGITESGKDQFYIRQDSSYEFLIYKGTHRK